MNASAIKIASYNIHGGIGADGRCVPRRIARVLGEIDADIVALQEVETRTSGFDMLAYLRAETGMHAVAGPTFTRSDAEYGNGLLTRFAVTALRRIDLSIGRYEPRGALDVELDAHGSAIRIVATHLGLRPVERREQIKRLLLAFGSDSSQASVLMGDINEWLLWGRPLRWLHWHFKSTRGRATFPARFPLFALDRIWIHPRHLLLRAGVHATPLARAASDHLPATAELQWACRARNSHDAAGAPAIALKRPVTVNAMA